VPGHKQRSHPLDTRYISELSLSINRQPFVIACAEASKWNEMEFYISKCTSEKDLDKLKDWRGRISKENVTKALDQHFTDLRNRKSGGR
jgi:hypothetical protein